MVMNHDKDFEKMYFYMGRKQFFNCDAMVWMCTF